MMTESLRLQDISREEVAAVQRSVLTSVGILSATLVLVVAASMIAAFRGIAAPLARLREGTRRVGAGDLEHTIGLTGKDEIADLAREFDRMSAQLKATTVSRDRLAESEERTRHIIETALDAVVSIDSDGRITGWNPQAEAVFGWTREEVLGRSLADTIIPHSQREAHHDGLRRHLATGEGAVLNKRVEFVALRKQGGEFPIEMSITPIRAGTTVTFSAFLRDITERKHAEAKVQSQLARLDLLNQITRATGERQDLQSIFQVVIRSLEDNAQIDFSCVCLYDPAAAALKVVGVGVKSAPLAMELAMPEQAWIPIDENGLSRCVGGHLVYEPEVTEMPFAFPQRLARGGLRSLVVAPLLVESKVFGVLVAARRAPRAFSSGECEFLRQLSEHVGLASHQAQLYSALQQAYDDLRQTQATVLQQERLRALGQMASGIAHDINNAISPVMLYTERLLERESGLSASARSALENIAHAIDDVAATVARMREFYRSREPELALSPLDPNRLVQQVSELTRARWSDMPQQRGVMIHMRHDLAPLLPAARGVDGEIREALINLVFNAVDAMPDGGELTLRTSVAPAAGGDSARIEVIDTGLGMDEATRRRCLEPFFTTKGERGTGLGLAMVYGAVQRHGADIDIRSAPGQGTTVELRFPVPSPAAALGAAAVADVDAMPPRMRILLVDDDPLLLRALRETLEADGHVVATANSGQAGIDAFREGQVRNEAFAVVVTDLGMPYIDGRKVAAAIKRSSPGTPVILLTGWGQRLIGDGDIPEHVDHVLSKPPKLRELRVALSRATAPRPVTE
jgi:PAS domain S-box-containing protein